MEDSTRSDLDYLCQVITAAIEAGTTIINLPDTVGCAFPNEYAAMFTHIRKEVKGIGDVVLSAHCHNDLGLATANSLAALSAGVRQVECTINGIGERAGNAALEEPAAAMYGDVCIRYRISNSQSGSAHRQRSARSVQHAVMKELLNELETFGDLIDQVLEVDLSREGELTFRQYEPPRPD